LELRRRSSGRVSLDDVMTTMWRRFQSTGEGIEEEGFEALVAEVLGQKLDPFFASYVHGTEEIDYPAFLSYAGIELFFAEPSDRKDAGPKGHLGAVLETLNGRVRLKEVPTDTPAALAGLSPGDEILAFEGRRVEARSLEEWVAAKKPGTEVRLH